MRSESVKLGLIGCGHVAVKWHLPTLESMSDVQVVALADTNAERLKRVAARFQVAGQYLSYGALLDDPDVEAVAVCVPPQAHREITLAALEADKHVFVEKPLALSLDECDVLIERAARGRKKATVGHQMRWHRLVREAQSIVKRGALGPIKAVRCVTTSPPYNRTASWLERRELGGGVLVEVAVHTFDLWHYLLQSKVEELHVMAQPGRWADDTAMISARLVDGMLATALHCKGTANSYEVELYGQKGRLRISLLQLDGLQFLPASAYPGQVRTRLANVGRGLLSVSSLLPYVRAGGDYAGAFRAQWQHFVSAIQRDLPVETSLADGRRAVQVAIAAVQSASTGKPVQVSRAARSIERALSRAGGVD